MRPPLEQRGLFLALRFVALGLALFLAARAAVVSRRPLLGRTALVLPIALYTVLVAASVLYSVDRHETLGSLLTSHGLALAVFALAAGGLATSGARRRLALGCAALFAVGAGLGVASALVGERNQIGGITAFGFRNSNSTGSLLGSLYPYLLAACALARGRALRAAAAVAALLGLGAVILSFSRGATAGALAAFLAWSLLRRARARRALVALVVFLAAFAVLAPNPVKDRFLMLRFQMASLSGRIPVWEFDLEKIAERPLLGWGYGIGIHRSLYLTPENVEREGIPTIERRRGEFPDAVHEHSAFVAVLLQTGLVGLALYLWVFLGTIVVGARALRAIPPGSDREILIGALAALVGEYGVHALVDRNHIGRWGVMLWVSIGLVVGIAGAFARGRGNRGPAASPGGPRAPRPDHSALRVSLVP